MKTKDTAVLPRETLKVFGENLRRRRLILDLTQEKAAESLGVTRLAYGKYESGMSQPDEDVCAKLVERFGIPVSQYFRVNEPYQLRFFRKRKRQTQRESALIEQVTNNASRRLRDYVFLENVTNEIPPSNSLVLLEPSHGKKSVEQIAAEVRARLKHLGFGDNELLGRVLENHGIKILEVPFGVPGCFGFTLKLDEKSVAIVVNTDRGISRERRLFTMAHELGHILLHAKVGSVEKMSDAEITKLEKEANTFASALLMPDDAFKEEWELTYGLSWISRVLAVKQAFRVSYETVLHRLDEGRANKGNSSLYAMFRQQYMRLSGRSLSGNVEPSPYSFQSQPLPRFAALCRKAYEKNEISLSRMAELMDISYAKARELSREW